MRILHVVESYLPRRHGMSEVVAQISERLVQRGHEVTVATRAEQDRRERNIRGVRVEEFAITGSAVRDYKATPTELDRYRRFLAASDHDVAGFFAAQQWAVDLALPMLGEVRPKKVFVPTGFSELWNPKYRDYFNAMPGWMRQFDANVFLSNRYRDFEFARQHQICRRWLIPNGASEDEFLAPCPIDVRKRLGIPPDHALVLHVGSPVGYKGQAEAVSIFAKADISRATLLLLSGQFPHRPRRAACGDPVPLAERRGVRLLFKIGRRLRGYNDVAALFRHASRTIRSGIGQNKVVCCVALSRQETVSAFQAADVFLFPSYLECSPIVLFEAMASRTPFLATDVGNSAEIASWSSSGLILPTQKDEAGNSHPRIDESASMLTELINNAPRRAAMAEAGFSAWRKRFTWEKVTLSYESLYRELLERKGCE